MVVRRLVHFHLLRPEVNRTLPPRLLGELTVRVRDALKLLPYEETRFFLKGGSYGEVMQEGSSEHDQLGGERCDVFVERNHYETNSNSAVNDACPVD